MGGGRAVGYEGFEDVVLDICMGRSDVAGGLCVLMVLLHADGDGRAARKKKKKKKKNTHTHTHTHMAANMAMANALL